MVKTEALDPELARVGWLASNFVWCLGYSFERSRAGLDLLIHKRHNDHRVDKLRLILLFDIETNMQNKRLGCEAMKRAESCRGVSPEQYGHRRDKASN
eukprot:6375214-Ditylum_brightwellii.AAC.1